MTRPRTLRLWVLPGCGFDTLPTVQGVLAGFLREAPGLRVDVTVRTADSLWKNLMRLLKRPDEYGDARPDVVELPSHWTSALAHLGLLEDLSGLEPIDLGAWVPAASAHCGPPGRVPMGPQPIGTAEAEKVPPRVFSLPWWMEVWVLYYRADVFRRLKLDPQRQLADWPGLAQACRRIARLRARDCVHPIANSNPRESVSLSDVAPAVWCGGGELFSNDGDTSFLHRDETYAGVRDYFELLANGWMPLSGKSGLVPENLFDGRCALQFSGRYPRGIQPRLSAVLGALPCPGPAGIVTARHAAVARGTFQPREALALARHLCGPASNRYADALGAFSCAGNWSEGVFDGKPELRRVFEGALGRARTLPNAPLMASVERVFERSMERLIRSVLRGTYQKDALREELLFAKAEMDCVLAMAPGGRS